MACPRLPFRPQTLLKQTKQILNNSMIFLTSLFVMRPTTELKNKREFLHSGQRHTESASQQRLNSTRTHVFSTNFTLLCASRRTTLEGAKNKIKLIEDGILSDYDIEKRHLDHEADVLSLEFDRNKKWTEQVSSILVAKRICEDMIRQNCDRILLFVNEIRQARTIAGLLRDHSISSTVVYGKLPRDEQKSRMNGFALGHFQVLISVDLLREGVDVPLVDGIVIMRRGLTNEDPMFSQILGRGLRGVESNGTPYLKIHVNNVILESIRAPHAEPAQILIR